MLTKKQLSERGSYVGASDASKIVLGDGVYDLWLEKTGKLEGKQEVTGAMEDGIMLEPMIVRWASRELGPIERRGAMLELRHAVLPLVSHPDGLVKASGEPVEAKTSGLRGPLMAGWGEPGTDQIPERYLIQASVHILCAKVGVCHVPAYLGGRGAQMFHVEHNETLCEMILTRIEAFWKLVQSDTPPEGWPSIEVARMIRRTEGKRLMLPAGPVALWREADAEAKRTAEKADECKAAVLTLLGDAEIGETDGGIVTAKKTKTKRIDLDALRKDFADVAAKVTKETESIQVSWKPKKEVVA